MKEVENYINYVCFKEKKISKKKKINLDKIQQIHLLKTRLYEDKRIILKQILYLKSAFSVIDEMFVKEMENAELKKKYWIRHLFLCGFGIREKTIDPRKINRFIREITTPYADDNDFNDENKNNNNQSDDIEKGNKNNLSYSSVDDFIKKVDFDIGIYDNNLNILKMDLQSIKTIYEKLEQKMKNTNLLERQQTSLMYDNH